MLFVENILEHKERQPNYVEPDVLVIDALKKLMALNSSYLVVKEDGEYKGIFSERDYTRKLVLQGRSSRDTPVREVMTTNLPEVSLSSTLEDCMLLMNRKGSRYLATFDGDTFLGIVTIHDVLRHILANKNEIFDSSLTSSLLDNDETGKIF